MFAILKSYFYAFVCSTREEIYESIEVRLKVFNCKISAFVLKTHRI